MGFWGHSRILSKVRHSYQLSMLETIRIGVSVTKPCSWGPGNTDSRACPCLTGQLHYTYLPLTWHPRKYCKTKSSRVESERNCRGPSSRCWANARFNSSNSSHQRDSEGFCNIACSCIFMHFLEPTVLSIWCSPECSESCLNTKNRECIQELPFTLTSRKG